MRHIILGAGPAGVIAAETIRKHAPRDEVYLVGDEPEAPYSRMAIPYLLHGSIGEGGTHLRHAPNHYESLGIQLKRNRAVRVDTVAKTVTMDDGSVHGFDRLLIATGSSPATPPNWAAAANTSSGSTAPTTRCGGSRSGTSRRSKRGWPSCSRAAGARPRPGWRSGS